MSNFVSDLLSDGAGDLRPRVRGLGLLLLVANVAAWLCALAAFAGQPVLLGTAALAYSLGLRHGLDPDHIAAIDNVTRRLMQEGKRPVAVGFFFALGHSTVVVVASAAVALAASAFAERFGGLREIGNVVGTSASALFLFAIAAANLVVLRGVYQAFRRTRAGHAICEDDLEALLAQRGWLARLFRPLFRLVSRSSHMFPIGVLFALGFDTASAISLFGLSVQASHDVSAWSVLVFPALFAAAMTLVDTADGRLRLGLRQAGAQAVLQSRHHLAVGSGRTRHRRDRGARAHRRPFQQRASFLAYRQRNKRKLRHARLRDRCAFRRRLDRRDAALSAARLRARAGAVAGDQFRMTRWRHDIDALAFQPEGHRGTCVVHRLAFRTLMRLVPTPDACIAYFAAHEGAFRASAKAKISRRRLQPGANFHLTSRDLARALTVAK